MSNTQSPPRAQAATATAAAEPEPIKRKRILLVEGDGFTRLVLLLRLRLAGFAVDFTSNGFIGLGKLRNARPDALLVELKLYGLSGLELIRAARAEPTFGNRPIYVFTHVDRMNRSASKEVARLVTKLFDKNSVSRENLVQMLVPELNPRPAEKPAAGTSGAAQRLAPNEIIRPEDIAEVIAGVGEQAATLAKCKDNAARLSNGNELLSRVRSLAECAEAARLPNLGRQAEALGNFLTELGKKQSNYTDAVLTTVARTVEVMRGISCDTDGPQKLSEFKAVVVDATPGSNRTMAEALLSAGFDPDCFEDAAGAREHLASKPTNLIVINLLLPEAHGLSLPEIRRLPFHAQTPVVFARVPQRYEFSAFAPSFDRDPLLVAELTVRALNEVQAKVTGFSSEPPKETKVSSAAMALGGPASAALMEDRIELFAPPVRNPEPPAVNLPAEPEPAPTPVIVQPLVWAAEPLSQEHAGQEGLPQPAVPASNDGQSADDVFTAAGVPKEVFLREPGAAGIDRTLEELPLLPETSTDASQVEEHPVEVSPVSPLQPEAAPSLEPEPTAENQNPESPAPVSVAGEAEQGVVAVSPESDSAPGAAVEIQESPNDEEVMNNQLEEAPAILTEPIEDTQPAEASGALEKAEARCAALEKEVASLRQAFADFGGSSEVEAELRNQLEAAKTASQQSETARQQAETRCAELEKEIGTLRQAQKELAEKAAREQKAKAESSAAESTPTASAGESEQQVRQGVAALARATAELARERGERQRSDQRAADLTARLQSLHEDLKRSLKAQSDDLAHINSLEEQQRQTSQALEQRTADLEQERAERTLLEEEAEKAKGLNAQLRKDLAFFEETNKKFGGSRQELQARLEASLNAVRDAETRLQQETAERQRLGQSLEAAQRELSDKSRKLENLERELQGQRDTMQEREAKLQKESAERQRLAEALDSVQRRSHDGSERDLELSKLESELEREQVERKRQESLLARMRHTARDAAHAARSLRSSLRRQIREPVDNLVVSTQRLLEQELGEQQKKLAEAVLQDVLLVQTRLREPEVAHSEPAEAAAPATTPAS